MKTMMVRALCTLAQRIDPVAYVRAPLHLKTKQHLADRAVAAYAAGQELTP